MCVTVLASEIFLMLLLHAFCYEPVAEDFKCFNDYEREMKCHISHGSIINCSAYNLNVGHAVVNKLNKYTCSFEQSHFNRSVCECKLQVHSGFVLTEKFTTTLLKGMNVLYKKSFETQDFIKPKTPNLSVQKTENGNFKVTWDSKYEKPTSYVNSLRIKLTYGIKGENEKIYRMIKNSVGFYEIMGRNLQPNTVYILTASMSTEYNDHEIYSDESAPYEFTTSSSPNEILKIVIPAICVALIFIIFTTFFLFFWVKRVWWDKISKPNINPDHGEKNTFTLPPSFMTFSPIRVEIPNQDHRDEKKLISLSSMDTNSEKSSNSVDSAVDYAQTCSSTQEKNITALVEREMHMLFPLLRKPTSILPPNNQVPVMSEYSLGTSSLRQCNHANRDSGNCSGSSVFSNLAYFKTPADDALTCDPCFKTEVPNYSNIENSPGGRETSKTQFNSPTTDTGDGYEDFNDVLKKDAPENLTNGSSAVVEKLIMRNLNTSKNPLYPIVTCNTQYQDFQSLTNNKEGQWSSDRTEEALSECGAMRVPQMFETAVQQMSWTPLLISSDIQIDNSYHCV